MKPRSFILTLVAAISAFALLATTAEAGDKRKRDRDRDDYGYYERGRGDDDRPARVRRAARFDRPARFNRPARVYRAPRSGPVVVIRIR